MRYYRSPTDRKHKRTTARRRIGQAADVYGCLATLPKPSQCAVRPFVILLAIVVSGSAQAQFPYNYAPYTPR